MLAEPLDIDLGPVGGRIRIEQPHDLRDSANASCPGMDATPAAMPMHRTHVLGVHIPRVPRHGVVAMGLAGARH